VGSYELLRPNSLISYRSLRRMASALRPKKANAESAEGAEGAEQPGEILRRVPDDHAGRAVDRLEFA